LVGVSGGLDSMVLLNLLRDLACEVHIAHVNYQLRGEESDGDEAFVASYAAEKHIPYYVRQADPELKESERGRSFQEVARKLRYVFFKDVAEKQGIEHIAVAHHQDDQAETVLLKLVQGSGMEGVAGMKPKRRLAPESGIQLIRPLLNQPREAILAYAKEKGIPWREDASNRSDAYKRNVMRNRVLPLLKEHFGQSVTANLARSATIFQGYWRHSLQGELERRFKKCCPRPDRLIMHALSEQPPVWIKRILLQFLYTWMPGKEVSYHMVDALLDLSFAQVGRKITFSTGTVWRERTHLVFVPAGASYESAHVFELPDFSEGGTLAFDGGKLDIFVHINQPESLTQTSSNVILVDKHALVPPLTVRQWNAGDRLIPFGMSGHKKVSDLLTDAKIPSHQRASTYVLEAAGEIIWVLGLRMADPVKVTEATKEIVRIVFHPKG
nr:tRNA lysidine(34) synthetase TilS [Rhodothermaceae bacterium]